MKDNQQQLGCHPQLCHYSDVSHIPLLELMVNSILAWIRSASALGVARCACTSFRATVNNLGGTCG